MIFVIRDTLDDTMVDIDTTENDIEVCIEIKSYTEFLLALDDRAKQLEFMNDVDRINQISEEYFHDRVRDTTHDFVRKSIDHFTRKWNLVCRRVR